MVVSSTEGTEAEVRTTVLGEVRSGTLSSGGIVSPGVLIAVTMMVCFLSIAATTNTGTFGDGKVGAHEAIHLNIVQSQDLIHLINGHIQDVVTQPVKQLGKDFAEDVVGVDMNFS